MSVRLSARNNSAHSLRIFMKFGNLFFFRKSGEKIQPSLKSNNNNARLDDERYIFLISSRSFLLRMRNVSEKKVEEKTKTDILCSIMFF